MTRLNSTPASLGARTCDEHAAGDGRRFDHLPIHQGFAFASIDSADTLDDPVALAGALEALGMIELPCVLVTHARLRDAVRAAGLEGMLRALVTVADDAAVAVLALRADIVIADTSGIAETCARAGTPVVRVGVDTIRAHPYPRLVAAVPSLIDRP